jgi:glycosyltransferase involved in cell wall biosynthesis
MKVLFATNHSYPPDRVGGSESSTHDLCLTLRDLGIDVGVLAASARHRFRQNGRFVHDGALGYPVCRAPRPAAVIHRVVRDAMPDVAVIQAGQPLLLAERFTAAGVPCVVYLRDAFFEELGGRVRERVGVRYLATSRDLARRFAAAFGIVASCIPPLVRPERYRVEPRRRNVTFVCPLAVKGLGIVLELAARRRDVPFVFQESWRLHPVRRLMLSARARAAGNIELRGPTDDMRSVYRDAKVVLVPSRCPEGWGRVVSEAQVSGIPVVASDLGGLAESVGTGGVLVDPAAAPGEWERALARLWDDPAEYARLAEQARQHALRPDFQPRAIAARLLAVLSDVVAGP